MSIFLYYAILFYLLIKKKLLAYIYIFCRLLYSFIQIDIYLFIQINTFSLEESTSHLFLSFLYERNRKTVKMMNTNKLITGGSKEIQLVLQKFQKTFLIGK